MRCRGPGTIACLTICTIACSESPNDPQRPTLTPGLRIMAGNNQTDTISARPAQGLVVEAIGPDASPITSPVLFSSVATPCPSAPQAACYPVLLASASDASQPFAVSATVTPDDRGRAVVRIGMGTSAGEGKIAITVPLHGYADTARYTVLPGAPVRVQLSPRDTTIAVGGSFQFRTVVTDRLGNAVSLGVSFESANPAVSVSGNGTVSGLQPGSSRLRARANVGGVAAADSIMVTVLPAARIAVSDLHGPIRLSTLTGSPERVLITGNVNAQDWSPAGDRLVYVDDRGNGEYALSVTDTLGVTNQLPVPLRSTWPQYSRDGWIYFFTQNDLPPQVLRIRADGTGMQYLMPGSFPAPAPDGIRIAVTTASGIWVGNPITGVGGVVPNTTSGIATRWSPDGQWIAYRDFNGITIIRPDGTGKRVIPAPYIGGIAWSPDSRWLLGGNLPGGVLQLIDTNTNASVYLGVRGVYPAWK